MKTPELLGGIVLTLALAPGIACNRGPSEADVKREASRAKDEIKVVASRAGDQLADSWITTKIQGQFFADNDIKARYINVSTRDGVVTLGGRVDNQNAHDQAVQTARNTDGVREVHDRLTIGPASQVTADSAASSPERMDAAWTTMRIQAKYFADPQVTSRDINVSTTNDVVTLTGRVENDQEKQRAVDLARTTDGVSRVEDRLMVQPSAMEATTGNASGEAPRPSVPQLDDSRVTSTIQSKYFLDDLVKGRRINVDTHQGIVTLRGEVTNENERAQALLLARTTDGVQRVEDNLTVTLMSASPTGASAMTAPRAQGSRAATPGAADAGTANAAGGAAAIDASRSALQLDDDALTTRIRSKFFLDRQVRSGTIDVTSKDGVVLLQGTVPSELARKQALSIARNTNGVVQVVDRLKLGRKK